MVQIVVEASAVVAAAEEVGEQDEDVEAKVS